MSEINSTLSPGNGKSNKHAKPANPYPNFPLFPHATRVWAKKIRGKMYYFGPWSDPDAALTKYLKEKDDLHAGKTPRPDPEALTVKEAPNAFLNAKKARREAGELSPRTWAGYKRAVDEVITAFGKTRLVSDLGPDDFTKLPNKEAKRLGHHGLGVFIQCVRCLFKYAFDSRLIPSPVCYGPDFKKPSKKTIRVARAKAGPKLFTAEEIHKLIGTATVHHKAMILLGINCGFGNSDCGNVPQSAVDLDAAMIDYP